MSADSFVNSKNDITGPQVGTLDTVAAFAESGSLSLPLPSPKQGRPGNLEQRALQRYSDSVPSRKYGQGHWLLLCLLTAGMSHRAYAPQ